MSCEVFQLATLFLRWGELKQTFYDQFSLFVSNVWLVWKCTFVVWLLVMGNPVLSKNFSAFSAVGTTWTWKNYLSWAHSPRTKPQCIEIQDIYFHASIRDSWLGLAMVIAHIISDIWIISLGPYMFGLKGLGNHIPPSVINQTLTIYEWCPRIVSRFGRFFLLEKFMSY